MTEEHTPDTRPPTLAQLFLSRVRETPDGTAYLFPLPDAGPPRWSSLTWAQAGARTRRISAGLMSLGVRAEDRVAIVSGTRVEWFLADIGIMCAGAATTTVYPTTDADEMAYIVADSGSRVVFAEDAGQLAKLAEQRDRLHDLVAVVVLDDPPADRDHAGALGREVLTLAELEERGEKHLLGALDCVERAVAAIDREHLATLIYTSGTTGRPKGVRLVHDCWAFQAAVSADSGLLTTDDLDYVWLPLAHAFGKSLLCAQLAVGHPLAVDGRLDRITDNLRVLRPTVMAAVPRVFEKIYSALVADARSRGRLSARAFRWAASVARDYATTAQALGAACGAGMETGRALVPLRLRARHAIADRLVLARVRQAFGGRLRACTSGGAPLAPDISQFFSGAGVPILEGYGLTESAAGTSFAALEYRIGTVGVPLPGTEVRILDSGEVLLRGPHIMRGYHNLPERTAEVLEPDGWFHTGDLGELTDDGYLRITGRIKELIKTSGGKYVAPVEIESRFKGACPYVSNIVVVGDNRNFCSALITLDPQAVMGWAEHHGLAGLSYAEVCTAAATERLIGGYVEQVNAGLQRWQTIKKFAVLPRDFSLERGEVTPSLKVRRKEIEASFADVIDAMYEGTRER
ncbi:AMP-dependent synthetase/ligase [Streptomyces sp. NPDC059866]|uniref:AMP-dependent synthetase/ligase n=1 Tax=Streptomyces sp. NPDC059866 TaxID=3346978 RepID=UPI003647A440